MLDSKNMKSKKYFILLCSAFLVLAGCDQGLKEVNTNPYALTTLDPQLMFANAVRQTHPGHWEGEATIVQQFMNAYNLGATAGFNFNEDTDNFNTPKWNGNYPNTIKLLVKAIDLAKVSPIEPKPFNLINMMRIWKAYVFMTMVDTYGDVPYSEAGKGDLDIFKPKYDDDAAIYDDLYNELKTATDALDPAADYVPADLFYRTGKASTQVAQWKKLGNSLLLRLGMRYSKLNPAKAQSIASEAVTRGVMIGNADDAYIIHNSNYNNPLNNGPRTNNIYYYYVAEPFVNQLKSTNDPRAKFMIAKYTDPSKANATTTVPDVTLANQYGFPVGYDAQTIKASGFDRGPSPAGSGLNYSQLNYNVIGSAEAPIQFVTYSQTKLLMAEAAFRGWIAGDPQTFYEDGVKASMDQWVRYPNGAAIPLVDQTTYLAQPSVLYNAVDALKLINTQYWISNIANGGESFANFRRSGYPLLTPNAYNNKLNGGFARRMAYPNIEGLQNQDNFNAAGAAIGGDVLTTRVFWDVP